jgi:serine/threonine protein kinase/Tfp pilus assembly protein PilF
MSELDRKAIAILRDALDTDPTAVDAYISRHCETDPELADRVRALLSRLRDDAAPDFSEPDAGSRTGAVVADRYRLLDRLGVGGMGEVYRAERIDGDFQQEVALKLVHGGFAALVDRFRRERQILARLTHPNIAHMIDGGVDRDGTPWLAMEYVAGERITTWCDARALDAGARVDLMRRICDAVQFAHRNLIVHRDIKPANILVADDGTPKLLDFGIAKLLDSGDMEATQTLAMTPAYAAPEQHRGDPVSTSTDVYQLGLVLFELICGTALHEARRLERYAGQDGAGPPSMSRAYAGTSTSEPDTARSIARQRGISPDRLSAMLKGDLGRIVAKALNESPGERYGSARELAEDLQRWRGDRPVLARSESITYRTRKFLRRHRIAVAFAGVSIASLASAIVGMAWKTGEATRETRRAVAVQSFLVSLFETNAPASVRDELPTTAELLEAGLARVRADFKDQPETRAELLAAIGRIYLQQSRYDEAAPLIAESLSLREQTHGPADPLVLESLLDSVKLGIETDRLEQARADLDRALAMAVGTADNDRRIEMYLASGILLFREGEWQLSADDARKAVDLIERSMPSRIGLVAPAYGQLAASLRKTGHVDEAVETSLSGIEKVRALYGEPHYDELLLYIGIVLGLRGIEDYEQAARYGRDAVTLSEAIFDAPHPDFATSLFALGSTLALRGDPVEAEATLRRSIGMFEAVFGPTLNLSTSELMYARLNLGTLLTRMGRPQEAESIFRQTIAELDAHTELRGFKATYAEVWIHLAASLAQQNRFDDARDLLAQALAILDTPDNAARYATLIANAHTQYASIDIASGDPAAALAPARRALAALQSAPAAVARNAALARLQLGCALLETGNAAGAIEELTAALRTFSELTGETSPETVRTHLELARALTLAGDGAEARIQSAAAREGAVVLPAGHPLRQRVDSLPIR